MQLTDRICNYLALREVRHVKVVYSIIMHIMLEDIDDIFMNTYTIKSNSWSCLISVKTRKIEEYRFTSLLHF